MVAVTGRTGGGQAGHPDDHAVFDTTILIDQLNGIAAARDEILRYSRRSISVITWIEVMTGIRSTAEGRRARHLLDQFEVHATDLDIAEVAARLRRDYRLRTPDAIIWATAQYLGALLVSRNTKDFPTDHPDVCCPYVI